MEHSNHSNEQQQRPNVLRFPTGVQHPRGWPVNGSARGEGAAHLPAIGRSGLEVEFRNVSLQDPASGRELLRDISFHVSPGMRVGIVGPGGSGKISLLNLLTRFQEPSRGVVLLDGNKLREYELDAVRRQFSIVPQEPMLGAVGWLGQSTVAANIAAGDPRATRADVVRAAKLANAHEFIEALPQGYDTILAEGGCAGLAPGERQRLAIARAFLKDAPMLVLDEPVGAQDLPAEQLILEALDRLMVGRTSFTIAHRISTLERCDMVLVLKNGSLDAVCTGDDYAKAPRLARPAPGSVPRRIDMLDARPNSGAMNLKGNLPTKF